MKCYGTRAETKFRLSAKRTSPFKSAVVSVQSTTGSRGVRISGSNAGYTMFRGSVKGTGYPLHSPISPSLPIPSVTVCHHISTAVYHLSRQKAPYLHSIEGLHPPGHPATAEILGSTIKGTVRTSECLFKLVTLPIHTIICLYTGLPIVPSHSGGLECIAIPFSLMMMLRDRANSYILLLTQYLDYPRTSNWRFFFFHVLLNVHLSIILAINQLNAQSLLL